MSQTKAQLIDAVDGSIVTADLADDAVNADKLASNSVVSASIVDGSILNVDINASAAIAGSKLNPVSLSSVGIGTASPAENLHINSTSGSARIRMTSADGSDNMIVFGDQSDNATGSIKFDHSDNSLALFGFNNSERMRIDSSGNVGIGTSSPNQNLMVMDTIANQPQIRLETSDGGSKRLDLFVDSSSNAVISAQQSAQNIEINARNHTIISRGGLGSEVESMRITSAGNVGIGTTSPSTLLHANLAAENGSIATFGLSGQTNNQSFIIKADDSDSLFTFRFGSSNSTYPAVRFNMGADQEAMRIDSSGNVGIGTTSPTSALNVAGRLDVDGLQNQNTAEIVANSTSGQSFGLLVNAGSTSADYCANFRDKDAGAIMILRGDGDIGIGTSTPNRTIEIKKSSPGIRLEETSSGGSKRLEFFVDSSEANIAAPQSAQTIMFSVSGSDTMRLARSGSHAEMFLNCNETFTSAVFSLQTNGTCGIGIKTGATNSQKHISFRNPNGEVGQIVTGSNSTTYDTTSDYRLKENEVAISDGITRLKTLKPYKFNFKNTPSEILDGFYAHEVMTVVPQAVNGEKDEVDSNGDPKYQGIDHSMIVPLIVAAVKELITKVESLEAA